MAADRNPAPSGMGTVRSSAIAELALKMRRVQRSGAYRFAITDLQL
jgi:hypothetical protein